MPKREEISFCLSKNIKGNQYGRQEEVYICEDCGGCPYAVECRKTEKNRSIRVNRELTAIHQEVIENIEDIHGTLLRMNRSIQVEGTFGIIKNDRWYKRIFQRGIESVQMELFYVLKNISNATKTIGYAEGV